MSGNSKIPPGERPSNQTISEQRDKKPLAKRIETLKMPH
jgi:hypothetical protein